MVYLMIGLAAGLIIGLVIKFKCVYDGVLLIDHSNPEKDVYRFCISNLDKLSGKKEIRLRINHDADLSQE